MGTITFVVPDEVHRAKHLYDNNSIVHNIVEFVIDAEDVDMMTILRGNHRARYKIDKDLIVGPDPVDEKMFDLVAPDCVSYAE